MAWFVLGLQDDRQGDSRGWEGSWREDKKDVKEIEEQLKNFVAIAEAMHKANWSFLKKYSILKEMCAALCAMAADFM